MDYIEEVLEDKSVIILRVSGWYQFKEVVTLGLKYRKKALDLNYRLIVDFREADSNITVAEITSYFDNFFNPIDKRLSQVPVAYISNEKDYPFFKLMQQIWGNKGIFIVVFKERESSLKWFDTNSLPGNKS